MGGYIVLAFAAAQFVSYFGWSNLGLMLALSGAQFLKEIGLGEIPLLLGIVLISAGINLFIGSASAKWALLAPVVVPMLMGLGFSPELAQATYRVGDSVTNIITPLLPYFPLILTFAQKYDPNLRIGTVISSMLPYSIAFGVGWAALLLLWYFLGLPLGPDAPLRYVPAGAPPL
jgi:aminobenzoyl-glutamate transport protein